ncbi:mobile mystery protein A [Flagellimonas flava]|uniref:mobile mystery protein A n=1 Tax=Flagellimonas flava TaxID=570519 RepID=UPI003D653507
MRNRQQLLVEQLDQKLRVFQQAVTVSAPERGWVHAIRTTLNMTMAQLGTKLNITRQGVKRIENSEAVGAITLNSLQDVAHALDLQLVYGFVPKDGSLDQLIKRKAEELAQKIVLRTHQNMRLEDQGIEGGKVDKAIKDLAEELSREVRRSIWD